MKIVRPLFPFALFAVTAFLSVNGQMDHSHPASPLKDEPNRHNMLVVGEKTVFLSHLPMFQESGQPLMPHRFQVLLEVHLEKPGGTPQAAYFKDRQSHPSTKIYTIKPELFVLPNLVASDSLRTFKGDVFRGHLEKLKTGEGKILSGLTATVKRVVHFREFDPAAARPAQLEYLLFGKSGELFLAHYLIGPPDFDQVLSVQVTGRNFTDEELAKGLKLSLPGTSNAASSRLKEKEQKDAEFKIAADAATQKIRVLVKRELFFEEGELRVPAEFNTTKEEKKAGFL